jgi:hypothetical protein
LRLVLKSEAFAGDADDERVVEDAIGHRHAEHAVASEGAVLLVEESKLVRLRQIGNIQGC